MGWKISSKFYGLIKRWKFVEILRVWNVEYDHERKILKRIIYRWMGMLRAKNTTNVSICWAKLLNTFPIIAKWLAWKTGDWKKVKLELNLWVGGSYMFILSDEMLLDLRSKGLLTLDQVSVKFWWKFRAEVAESYFYSFFRSFGRWAECICIGLEALWNFPFPRGWCSHSALECGKWIHNN